jgi:hypothetical protein
MKKLFLVKVQVNIGKKSKGQSQGDMCHHYKGDMWTRPYMPYCANMESSRGKKLSKWKRADGLWLCLVTDCAKERRLGCGKITNGLVNGAFA